MKSVPGQQKDITNLYIQYGNRGKYTNSESLLIVDNHWYDTDI